MKRNLSIAVCLSTLLLANAAAQAQPVDAGPQDRPADQDQPPAADQRPADQRPVDQDQPRPADPPGAQEPFERDDKDYDDLERRAREMSIDALSWRDAEVAEPAEPATPPPPFPKMRAPQLLSSPTGHLLPAAVIQSTASLDTGGSFGGSVKIGLGDVGEFGLETTPLIRMKTSADSNAETVQPLVLASFRMGVGEDRLFENQPALALGFRKSFSRKRLGSDIRVAGIDLVASKTFGKTSVHAGGVFWDAQLENLASGDVTALHDGGARRQIRPFGGIEAEPIKNAQLLVDLYWVPQFNSDASSPTDAIKLKPTLSWGVRYQLVDRVSFESGVRVPDIGDANLLDAQIFGQLTMSTDKIRRALGVSE